MADGKVIIETALDATGVEKGISMIQTALAAIGIGAIAKDIVDTGSQFEATMSKVGAISGATASEMDSLKSAAQEMGRTSVFSASQSAEAMTYMGMAGWDASQMIDGLPGIMNLAAASGEELGTVSDIVTDALTGFGLKASDASHFADVLAAASSSANTNVGMLGESFKYVAPVAGALGSSCEDTTLALALMANSGIKASQSGTALRTALTNMANPTDKMEAAMTRYGIALQENADGSINLRDTMDNMREALGGVGQAEQAAAASAIFGKEAMSGMLAIINASDEDYIKLQEAIDGSSEAFDGMGTATGMAQQMVQNFSGQMTLLDSALEGMKLAIWENLQEPLTNMATVATDSVTALTDAFIANGVPGLAQAAADMALGFMNGLNEQIPSIMVKGREIVLGVISGITENGPSFISTAADMILNFATGIGASIPELIPKGVEMVVALGESVVENIPKIVQAGVQIIQGIGEGIVNALPTIIEKGPALINDFFDAIYSGAGTLIGAGLELIVQLGKGIIDNIPTIVANAKEIGIAILNVISAIKILDAGKNLIKLLQNGIKEKAPVVKEAMTNLGQKALNAVKNINWKNLGSTVVKTLKGGISGSASLVKTALKAAGTAAKNAFKAISWKSLGQSIVKLLINGLKAAGKGIKTALKAAGTAAKDAFKGINWASVGKAIITGIVSGVKNAASSLYNSLKNLATSALNKAKSVLGIHSPSSVFRDMVGRWIPRGIAVGVEDSTSDLVGAVENMSEEALDAAAAASSDLSGEVANALMPSPEVVKDYFDKFVQMLSSFNGDIPAVKSAQMGISFDTITRFREMATAMGEELKGSFDNIKEEMKQGIAEGMKNVDIKLDGRSVGKGIAPYVERHIVI